MQMSKQIIEVLEYLGEKLGVTIDWSSQNVVPYVQNLANKYIHWEIATSTAWIVTTVICLIITLILLKILDWEKGSKVFVFVIVFAIGVCIVGIQTKDILKCKYFPELQIYEYISSMMDNR